jgi:3-hydroxyisobutyrate dehydrogenase-like beta-hydroxyacid dehydrogenase
MSDTSRRKFLAAAGAGTAATAVVGFSGGTAHAATSRSVTAADEPVVAYVQNPKAGVLHLMVGEREVIVEDHDLVARILNAAGSDRGGN